MIEHGKRYKEATGKIEADKICDPSEALAAVKEAASAKFNETVDIAVRLGVDPRHGDQMVRGTTTIPHGTGKVRRVAVFAKGEKAQEAHDAGADTVGAEDLVAQIQNGWRDFDILVATPDVMAMVGKLGRTLGPRMPNPKAGTVTMDVARVVRDIKAATPRRVQGRQGWNCPHGYRKGLIHSGSVAREFLGTVDRVDEGKAFRSKGSLYKEDSTIFHHGTWRRSGRSKGSGTGREVNRQSDNKNMKWPVLYRPFFVIRVSFWVSCDSISEKLVT